MATGTPATPAPSASARPRLPPERTTRARRAPIGRARWGHQEALLERRRTVVRRTRRTLSLATVVRAPSQPAARDPCGLGGTPESARDPGPGPLFRARATPR